MMALDRLRLREKKILQLRKSPSRKDTGKTVRREVFGLDGEKKREEHARSVIDFDLFVVP